MPRPRVPSRFIAWLAISVVFSVGAVLNDGSIQIGLLALALLPLLALAARATMRRSPSIALSVLLGALLLLFSGAAFAATLVTLVGQLLLIVLDLLTRTHLAHLISAVPRTPTLVRVERLNREELVPATAVKLHDRVLVQPGEHIPVDGRLILRPAKVRLHFGTHVQEHAPGEILVAGSLAQATLRLEALTVGKDTTIAALQDIAHRLTKEVPPALVRLERLLFSAQMLWSVALLTWWALAADHTAVAWFSLAGTWWLGILVSRLGWMRLLVRSIKHGVLITTWEAVRRSRNLRTAVLDKTGTVTDGTPYILQVLTTPQVTREDLLRLAAALEFSVDHPIARTLKRTIAKERLKIPVAESVVARPSMGLEAVVEDERFAIGNARLVTDWGLSVPEEFSRKIKLQEAQGATVLYVQSQEYVLGVLILKDTVRPSARELVEQLRKMKFSQVQLLSGDTPLVARATGATIGVAADSVFAQVSAERKKLHVQQLPRLEALAVGDPLSDKDMLAAAGLGVGFLGWGAILRERTTQVLVRSTDLLQVARTIQQLRQMELVWWLSPIVSASASAVTLTILAIW